MSARAPQAHEAAEPQQYDTAEKQPGPQQAGYSRFGVQDSLIALRRQIVSGAAVVTQGLAEAGLGYRFSPRELRNILTSNGTASANPTIDKIGVMPDLRAIITGNHLDLAPDLYLRDYVGDAGNPTNGIVSQSPDIIVKQAAVANPQATYGAGGGTENNDALSDDVDTGHDNFVYVRLLDRGGAAAHECLGGSVLDAAVDAGHSIDVERDRVGHGAVGSQRKCAHRVRRDHLASGRDSSGWSLLLCGGGRRCAGPQAGPHELPHVRRLRDVHRKQQQRRVAKLQRRGGSALGRIASEATIACPSSSRAPSTPATCSCSRPLRGYPPTAAQ